MGRLARAGRNETSYRVFQGRCTGQTLSEPEARQWTDTIFSRITEVITEAIPQAIVQTLVLLLHPFQRTFLQYFSLFTSFLTTGFVVASSDKEFDTSKLRREQEPVLFGYVPKVGAHRQMLASVSFFTLYKFVKVFSLCPLIASSSFRYAADLLTLEFFTILAWRKYCGN